MKTPEEIKKGLARCPSDANCNLCLSSFHCDLEADALALIQQLEAERADYERFQRLRKKTFDGIKKALAIDSHCKSYEGAFEVHHLYTDYFEDGQACKKPETVLRLHCYVLGPARHYEWKGKTFAEALSKAEWDIDSWIAELEVE